MLKKQNINYGLGFSADAKCLVIAKCQTQKAFLIANAIVEAISERSMSRPHRMVHQQGAWTSEASLRLEILKPLNFSARPVVHFSGPARNTIFYFRPVWASENLLGSMF